MFFHTLEQKQNKPETKNLNFCFFFFFFRLDDSYLLLKNKSLEFVKRTQVYYFNNRSTRVFNAAKRENGPLCTV